MPLIKHGQLADDPWVTIDCEAAVPDNCPAILSLEDWRDNAEQWQGCNSRLGIRLRSDQSPEAIRDRLDRFEVVALEFPKFGDGRSYSHARLLRERVYTVYFSSAGRTHKHRAPVS